MSDEVYGMILEKSKTIDPTDFNKVRAYTLVLMCINTGTRNKEIRFAEVRDLDTMSWLFDIIHVKGEATYGQPREVPIPPEIHQLILTYLMARQKWVVDNSVILIMSLCKSLRITAHWPGNKILWPRPSDMGIPSATTHLTT